MNCKQLGLNSSWIKKIFPLSISRRLTNQELTTCLGNLLRKSINSPGWSSPSPPGRTFPGVESRTQTYTEEKRVQKKKLVMTKSSVQSYNIYPHRSCKRFGCLIHHTQGNCTYEINKKKVSKSFNVKSKDGYCKESIC